MTNKLIQLARKLTISNEEDAKIYGLEQPYLEYFSEQDYQLESILRFQGDHIQKKSKSDLNNQLKTMYGPRFASKLQDSHSFLDLNDEELEIVEIDIAATTFQRKGGMRILNIFLISCPLEVIEIFGNYLTLKSSGKAKLIPVELNNTTTIYSTK